jgi:uncharacterized protein YjbK
VRLEDFSQKLRPYAKKLMKLLKKTGRIGFNTKMEVVIDGNVVKHSNIVDLVEHAVSRENSKKLNGVKQFYKLLNEIGVSNDVVRNKWGRSLVKHSKRPVRVR